MVEQENWVKHVIRANLNMEGVGLIRGVTGEKLIGERMKLWAATAADVVK